MERVVWCLVLALAAVSAKPVPTYNRTACEPYTICDCQADAAVQEAYGGHFGKLNGKLSPDWDINWEGCSGQECEVPLICLNYEYHPGKPTQLVPDCRWFTEMCASWLNKDNIRFKVVQQGVDSWCGVGRTCTFEKMGGDVLDANASDFQTVNTYQPGYQFGPYRNMSDEGDRRRQIVKDTTNDNERKKKSFEQAGEDSSDKCLFSKDCKKEKGVNLTPPSDSGALNLVTGEKGASTQAVIAPQQMESAKKVQQWQEQAETKMDELKNQADKLAAQKMQFANKLAQMSAKQ